MIILFVRFASFFVQKKLRYNRITGYKIATLDIIILFIVCEVFLLEFYDVVTALIHRIVLVLHYETQDQYKHFREINFDIVDKIRIFNTAMALLFMFDRMQ